MTASPGRQVSRGYFLRKCRSVRGSVPQNTGTVTAFCDSESPLASSRTQEKSFDSRTIGENDVRISALPASSAIATSRAQIISRAKGSLATRTASPMRLTPRPPGRAGLPLQQGSKCGRRASSSAAHPSFGQSLFLDADVRLLGDIAPLLLLGGDEGGEVGRARAGRLEPLQLKLLAGLGIVERLLHFGIQLID